MWRQQYTNVSWKWRLFIPLCILYKNILKLHTCIRVLIGILTTISIMPPVRKIFIPDGAALFNKLFLTWQTFFQIYIISFIQIIHYQLTGQMEIHQVESKGCKLCGIFWSLQSKSYCISVCIFRYTFIFIYYNSSYRAPRFSYCV
jgi:hypothetical protein